MKGYQLEVHGKAVSAARTVFLRLFSDIRAHAQGVLQGSQDDDVHDYRVSIRRTRSAMKLFKPILNHEQRQYFKEGFRSVARSTNHLRDLEVFLENRPVYLKALSREDRENIEPLFYYLEQEQVEEFKQLIIMLQQPGYHSFLEEWDAFLRSDDETIARDGQAVQVRLIPFADESVRTLFDRVQTLRSEVEQSEDYELMHQLRIECKQLRYALEFFHDLNPDRFPVVIKMLKKVQDHLGDLNDLVNHERITQDVIREWRGMDAKTDESCSACSALLAYLKTRQKELTDQFPDVFHAFTEKMNSVAEDDLTAQSIN
ncbi:CHAD domain-containing protein [bacterium]|nr:CHAD domain-containing protein [bacterium]